MTIDGKGGFDDGQSLHIEENRSTLDSEETIGILTVIST
jgi:hypothetical protein